MQRYDHGRRIDLHQTAGRAFYAAKLLIGRKLAEQLSIGSDF
jgi:hypothetical protein